MSAALSSCLSEKESFILSRKIGQIKEKGRKTDRNLENLCRTEQELAPAVLEGLVQVGDALLSRS